MKRMLQLRNKSAALGAAALLFCAAGRAGAYSPAPPPPETRWYSTAVYFVNNSGRALYLEVSEAETAIQEVSGSFSDSFFCVEDGDTLVTFLGVTGESHKASCSPNGLLASISLYDLADGSLLRTIEVEAGTFSESDTYPASYDGIAAYTLTIDNALLQEEPS
ncbi:MAG: hypothetical protein LBR16_05155 [Treponema sp.]|jgi:hypothetical protein|nr:hypothetical protein [Treponema sp.]